MQVPRDMQVPHEEVHERVSWILKNYGICPTEEGIRVGNLYLLTLLLSFSGTVVVIFYSSIHSFLLLVLEAIVMRMCYLKKSHLAKIVCKHLF